MYKRLDRYFLQTSNLIVARINSFVSFLVHYEVELTSNNISSHHFIHYWKTKSQQHQNLLSIYIGSDDQDLRLWSSMSKIHFLKFHHRNHLTYYNTVIFFEMLHNGKFYINLDLNSKSSCSMIIQCHPKQTVFFQPYAHMKNNHFMSQYL